MADWPRSRGGRRAGVYGTAERPDPLDAHGHSDAPGTVLSEVRSEVRELTPDLKSEHVWLKDFVCSPIWEAKNVFCSRMEGLFLILASSRKAKPLIFDRRDTITLVRANARQVVWLVDAGADKLAVDMLPAAMLPAD